MSNKTVCFRAEVYDGLHLIQKRDQDGSLANFCPSCNIAISAELIDNRARPIADFREGDTLLLPFSLRSACGGRAHASVFDANRLQTTLVSFMLGEEKEARIAPSEERAFRCINCGCWVVSDEDAARVGTITIEASLAEDDLVLRFAPLDALAEEILHLKPGSVEYNSSKPHLHCGDDEHPISRLPYSWGFCSEAIDYLRLSPSVDAAYSGFNSLDRFSGSEIANLELRPRLLAAAYMYYGYPAAFFTSISVDYMGYLESNCPVLSKLPSMYRDLDKKRTECLMREIGLPASTVLERVVSEDPACLAKACYKGWQVFSSPTHIGEVLKKRAILVQMLSTEEGDAPLPIFETLVKRFGEDEVFEWVIREKTKELINVRFLYIEYREAFDEYSAETEAMLAQWKGDLRSFLLLFNEESFLEALDVLCESGKAPQLASPDEDNDYDIPF